MSEPLPWRECVQTLIDGQIIADRFEYPPELFGGVNCDVATTWSDYTGWFLWTVSYPGDAFLANNAWFTDFFEMTAPFIGHTLSFWAAFIVAFLALRAMTPRL